MFDSICVRRQRALVPEPLDAGLLAELLVFYERVRVVADSGLLTDLIRKCGADAVVELVTSGRLLLTYLPSGLAIYTENSGSSNELHRPTTFTVPGAFDLQNALPRAFQDAIGKEGRGRRLAAKIRPHVAEYSFSADVPNAANEDFLDPIYMAKAVALVLKEFAPEYQPPDPLRFEVGTAQDMLRVETNVDFVQVNASHRNHFPAEISTVTPAIILSQILNALGDLHIGAMYTAELATDPASEALIRQKCSVVLAGRDHRAEAIAAFQALAVSNARAIREAVNTGQRDFRDVLALLESADRFRAWLREKEPTAELVHEYIERLAEGTWAETLPAKLARWAVASGAGFALGGLGPEGAAISSGLGAVDMFLLERFVKGWRPSQFVDGSLREFVDPEDQAGAS